MKLRLHLHKPDTADKLATYRRVKVGPKCAYILIMQNNKAQTQVDQLTAKLQLARALDAARTCRVQTATSLTTGRDIAIVWAI